MSNKVIKGVIDGSSLGDIGIGVLASFALALAAPLTIHLPFSPIPMTIQVQLVFFLSVLLGPKKALVMVLAFLLQGAMGWPVFAGGASGVINMIGPRGGYLVGYLISAYFVGKLYRNSQKKSALRLFFCMGIGNLIVYACGFSWLAGYVGLKKAFFLGIVPFAFLDFVKLSLFTALKAAVVELLHVSKKY